MLSTVYSLIQLLNKGGPYILTLMDKIHRSNFYNVNSNI